MTRRIGESAMWRRSELLSRAEGRFGVRRLDATFVARGEHAEIKRKVRDRGDECAPRNLRCNAW